MTSFPEPPASKPPEQPHRRGGTWSLRLTPGGLVILLAFNLVVLGLLGWPLLQARVGITNPINYPATPTAAVSQASGTEVGEPIQTTNTPPPPSITPSLTQEHAATHSNTGSSLGRGTLVLSISEGGFSHLFAYQPINMPFTRLTNGPWDDITPAISPDQTRLAFASNRAGQWDLFLLDLASGEVTRLTDTPEYEAAPSWSPDGRWLVYEAYLEGNLEISIRALSNDQPPINLSVHPEADFSPTWSPSGRQVAFVSTRGGERDIWLADLDKTGDERFTNASRNSQAAESYPAWSPDGSHLAWSEVENGVHSLYLWKIGEEPRYVASGDWPAWSPDGSVLLTTLLAPDRTFLAAYAVEDNLIALPPLALAGSVAGLAWMDVNLSGQLPDPLRQAAMVTPTPLWMPALTSPSDVPVSRQHLVQLDGVEAQYPLLHDLVDEAFYALRARVASEAGWDLLASLENAYVPLTAPLSPGLGNDWLYTGRAFTFNPLPANAGWLVGVPEEFGPQTYWRIYIRARNQDGSQGVPLRNTPWDFNARYSGDPMLYEQGGRQVQAVPFGYWIDFTELAAVYGWKRLPALPTWRSSYPEARLNEFVLTGGQDWRAAMLELYPPEVLITPTMIIPPTLTPTPTPRWYRTPTPTVTSSPIPTLTPLVSTPTSDS